MTASPRRMSPVGLEPTTNRLKGDGQVTSFQAKTPMISHTIRIRSRVATSRTESLPIARNRGIQITKTEHSGNTFSTSLAGDQASHPTPLLLRGLAHKKTSVANLIELALVGARLGVPAGEVANAAALALDCHLRLDSQVAGVRESDRHALRRAQRAARKPGRARRGLAVVERLAAREWPRG